MKKSVLLILALTSILLSYQAKAVNSAPHGVDAAMLQITVGDIVDMNAKEYAQKTGQRYSVKERITFGIIKSKLKSEVKKGNLKTSDSPAKVVQESSGGFDIVAFLLALFLSIIGFAIVFFFFERSSRKAALIGLIVSVIVYGGIFLL